MSPDPEETPVEDPHHFDFDLDRGIRQQVVAKLEQSPMLPLDKNVGPRSSGIYALYYKGKLVYIGKASTINGNLTPESLVRSGQ